ncbi:ATP-binding protein [Niveibacterium sp. 24ML]|uniref:sensor histidine kinase n=1 Tax=Niveibacterium sp. 24ML TaxID=2985512 RepID=UPI00226FEEC9|nr:sensor histidine kinase [Niveibacterium sp. 24ML]MCX9158532.1 ATP-binding protein [Niveibacterium sp. 24ML]
MGLTFKARVLLELGAELISSDGMALYELIKNGLDAGSREISIEIQVVLQPSMKRSLLRRWRDERLAWNAEAFLAEVDAGIDSSAPAEALAEFVGALQVGSRSEALVSLEDACAEYNSIKVIDSGCGMDKQALNDCYLTVGTTVRLEQKMHLLDDEASDASDNRRIPLGEKGIGRLAAMRLGHFIRVVSAVESESNEYVLDLDWRPVYANPMLGLDHESLQFKPVMGGQKSRHKGTTIVIKDLQSDWDLDKLRELSRFDLGKLADPFQSAAANQFLAIKFQGKDANLIGVFEAARLKCADAVCTITFRAGSVETSSANEDAAELVVNTVYRLYKREEELVHAGPHLATAVSYEPKRKKNAEKLARSDEVVTALKTLGDFEAKFYWFNRGRFLRDEKVLWSGGLGDFVRNWSGGLLVYRDGFRVYPYGSAQDDWLDLDRKALASSAYKLNRAQIVGYLRITSRENPKLIDQTNREGFRDSPEREALRRLLRQAIIADCKSFLEKVDKENKVADEETLQDIDARIGDSSQNAAQNLKRLKARVPAEAETIQSVLQELGEVQDAWNRAKQTLKSKNEEVETYTHLAGVGLMVELLAHELARTTQDALELLADKKTASDPQKLQALAAVLKTLNKRIRVIDVLSIPGRQRKEVLSIPTLVEEMRDFYEAKFEQNKVNFDVVMTGARAFTRKVERGQIIQIFDNIFNNSVFWLARRLNRDERPQIRVDIDTAAGLVAISDNGPGISEDVGNRVFDAFYTSKGANGRGLGLYISKKLAAENDAELELLPAESGVHNGFVLKF